MRNETSLKRKPFGKMRQKVNHMGTTRKLSQCKKCNHVWLPRAATGKPRICPNCKSARWDVGPAKAKENEEGGTE